MESMEDVMRLVCVNDRLTFTAFLLVPLLSGMCVAYGTRNAVVGWYQQIKKPWFTPPDFLFGPAWTVLYLLMGYASYRVYSESVRTGVFPTLAVVCYVLQFLLNNAWSLCFFNLKRWDFALVDITALWLVILGCIFAFSQIEKVAGLLLTPYLGFVSVAALLNVAFIRLNPEMVKQDTHTAHTVSVNSDVKKTE